MTDNIHIVKKERENSMATLKRFSQQFRSSGIMPRIKSLRYNDRIDSDLVRKQRALRKIKNNDERTRLKKLGKL